jgi:DNA-binding NtrC family response regulator
MNAPLDATVVAPLPELSAAGDVRLLIIDDDEAICQLMRSGLECDQYSIDAVSNPSAIESQLQKTSYHLILLDYIIPGTPIAQIFEWIKRYQPEASVIVITGFPSMDSAVDCLRAHTFDYITKPFQLDHLRGVVTRCLEGRGLLRLTEAALREALGAVIRERRKALGLTLAQMAQRTDISLGYLSQIELGKNSASIETLYRISLGLGLKMCDLFQTVQLR